MKAYYLILVSLLSIACDTQEKSNPNIDIEIFKSKSKPKSEPKKEVYKDPKLIFDSIYVSRIDTNQEVRHAKMEKLWEINDSSQTEIWKSHRKKEKYKPSKSIKYKYVKAYLYDALETEIIYDGKHLVPDILAMKTLSDKQAKEIFKIFTQKNKDILEQASCYQPRHGIVFYNTQNEAVAYISVCFECQRTSTFPIRPLS